MEVVQRVEKLLGKKLVEYGLAEEDVLEYFKETLVAKRKARMVRPTKALPLALALRPLPPTTTTTHTRATLALAQGSGVRRELWSDL